MSEQSRRSWIVTISQAAIGVGIAGNCDAAVKTGLEPLPPGLYTASTDHLGHALMRAEQFHLIVPNCPTDYVRPRMAAFKPSFFSESQFATVQRLAVLLLGEAEPDSTGSSAPEVAEWIDLTVASSSGVEQAAARIEPRYRTLAAAYLGSGRVLEERKEDAAAICTEGLAWLTREARELDSKDFAALALTQQLSLLDRISDQRPDQELQNAGTRLFEWMKREAIRAFYTSRSGLKELDYKGNAYYVRSPGCSSR